MWDPTESPETKGCVVGAVLAFMDINWKFLVILGCLSVWLLIILVGVTIHGWITG